MPNSRLCGVQDVAETQEKAGLKEECIEFYDKVRLPPQITGHDCMRAVSQYLRHLPSCKACVLSGIPLRDVHVKMIAAAAAAAAGAIRNADDMMQGRSGQACPPMSA